jgi:hypothetical protein
MGNGGSPPAHLPSSTAPDAPSFEDFPCVAAKWMQPPARAPDCDWMHEWETNIWELRQLLNEQAACAHQVVAITCACQEAAIVHARQEAADARASQEAAAARDPPGCASQNNGNNEYNDDYDKYDDNNEYDDDYDDDNYDDDDRLQ